MAQILDYSAGYPGARAVRDAGYEGVIRYLRKDGTSRVRPITAGELADMRAHGRAAALVYQHVAKSRPTQGRVAGRHDAEWALARARDLGVEPRCIYFAVDFDAQSALFPPIGEYMKGAAEVLGVERVGTYGKWSLLRYLFDLGLIAWGWQTYAWSPGHNKDPDTFEPRAHLFQRLGQVTVGGISCDVNDVLKADYGQDGGDMGGELVDGEVRHVGEVTTKAFGRHIRFGDVLVDTYGNTRRIEVKLDALAGALSNDEANVIAAVREIVAADQDNEVVVGPEHVDAIVAGVKAGLPPSITQEQVEESVRRVFADAGQETP